ncbi:Protein of unknown function, partial [Gryllus bimaculatus]
RVWDFPRGW